MTAFRTLGLIAKRVDDSCVKATLERTLVHLRRRGVTVWLEADTAQRSGARNVPALELAELGRQTELVVVVGGDGTLLYAARALAAQNVPLVGINLGRLGFLVDISPETIEDSLDRILAGEFDAETRGLLQAAVDEGGTLNPQCSLALNDVVIAKWNTVRMIEFETYIDGRFVNAQRSDGLIVATPTGSTAYALSGGGPLLHPTLEVLVLVPICPHTLSNRPLVVSAASVIDIRLCDTAPEQVRVTCDGQVELPLAGAAGIQIRRSPHRVRLLHPRGHDHYAILRAKLGWGGHVRSTAAC